MHETIDLSWIDRWEALFGYPFRSPEAGAAFLAEVESVHGVGTVTESEMVTAMRQYSEGERKEGRRAKAPTAGQVATYIKRDRWQRRQAAEGGPDELMRVPISTMLPPEHWREGQSRWRTDHIPLGQLRRDLANATPAERWTIICSPHGKAPNGQWWTDLLLSMAQSMGLEVERYVPAEGVRA